MARAIRNFYKGGIYHVIQRGINRAYIFEDHLDKAMFLEIIKETMIADPFEVLYYVIMDNHYHLLLQMKDASIGKVMQRINLSYSKYFNKKYHRSGTIFGSRYTCISIKDTKQFMTTVMYNAYNPVKAKMVKHPEEYRWCAHLEVVSSRTTIINRRKLLEVMDKDLDKAEHLYKMLLSEKINGIKRCYTEDEIKQSRKEVMQVALEKLCSSPDQYNEVLKGNRTYELMAIKKQFIKNMLASGFKPPELAIFLNMSSRSVNLHK